MTRLLIALVLLAGPVQAQVQPTAPAPTPITLEQLERLALQNNPTGTAATAGVEAARGHTRQAGAFPNPVIGYSGGEITTSDVDPRGEHGFFVVQAIPLGGKLRLSQNIFQKTIEQAEAVRAGEEDVPRRAVGGARRDDGETGQRDGDGDGGSDEAHVSSRSAARRR